MIQSRGTLLTSPWLIGVISDRVGLTTPVLATGVLLAVSGRVLLLGRTALERDLETVAEPTVRLARGPR